MRVVVVLAGLLLLAGCAFPSADQPAYFARMGRFMGLVANCGCSDVGIERMRADYAKALGGRYSEAEVKAMKGYVNFGLGEQWPNMDQICAETCSQTCMVQAVVEPLGGRSMGVAACLVSERDLHLTDGMTMEAPGGTYN